VSLQPVYSNPDEVLPLIQVCCSGAKSTCVDDYNGLLVDDIQISFSLYKNIGILSVGGVDLISDSISWREFF
jgi:hypothetical protein